MRIYKIDEILERLETCIDFKIPFSHIRFGDGGIKFIHSIIKKDVAQLNIIVNKEGLPTMNVVEILELWGRYARNADYIDTPEVYYRDDFWMRMRSTTKPITKQTNQKMQMWKELYCCAEFDNENYCNPESNYLMILRRGNKKNLLDVMKNKKICLITAKPHVKRVLRQYSIDVIPIVGHYQNQYEKSFSGVVDIIKNDAKKYDFWLVAAGELGRIYSGLIKECGGRTVDIGFVIEFWLGEKIHLRLRHFLERSADNPLELKLTEEGKKYDRFI